MSTEPELVAEKERVPKRRAITVESHGVYISNIHPSLSRNDVARLFSKIGAKPGEIPPYQNVVFFDSNARSAVAIVTYASRSACDEAIRAMNGRDVNDMKLAVSLQVRKQKTRWDNP